MSSETSSERVKEQILKKQHQFARFVLRVLRVFVPLYALTTIAGFAYSLHGGRSFDAFTGLACGAAATGFLVWSYRYVQRWQRSH